MNSYDLRSDLRRSVQANSRKLFSRLPGRDTLSFPVVTGTALTLDGSNCYPNIIRLTSGSAITIKLGDGQGKGGRHWVIEQAGAGVGTVAATTAGGLAVTRNGTKFKTNGQWSMLKVYLVAALTLSFDGGAA